MSVNAAVPSSAATVSEISVSFGVYLILVRVAEVGRYFGFARRLLTLIRVSDHLAFPHDSAHEGRNGQRRCRYRPLVPSTDPLRAVFDSEPRPCPRPS